MKKPIFILRLGDDLILDVDRRAIGHLQEGLEDIAGCSLPFGILTIIMTDQSPTELKDLYMNAARELNDHAPIVVWDPASDMAVFDLSDFPQVKEVMAAFEKAHDINIMTSNKIEKCELSLDDLLDKISRTSLDSLTPIEFARLKSLSK